MLKDDVDFSLYGDRFEIVPEGLASGTAGALTRAELIRDGKRLDIDLKRGTRLRKGDRVIVSTSGGAGYGDPRLRSRTRVLQDIEQGVDFHRDGKKRVRLRGVAGRRLTVSRRGCG